MSAEELVDLEAVLTPLTREGETPADAVLRLAQTAHDLDDLALLLAQHTHEGERPDSALQRLIDAAEGTG